MELPKNNKQLKLIIKKENKNMNPNKALWEKGDFTEIAPLLRPSFETNP